MTDITTPADETEDWGDVEQSANAYPEHPANPHNHRFTISYDPSKPPFVVVRANTAAELKAAFEELESSGVYAAMGAAHAALKAQGAVGAGLGPTTPVQAAQAAPQPFQVAAQQQYNQQPAQQFPNQAFPGQPAWQTAGAPQGAFNGGGNSRQGPKPRPDWPQVYKINVPFQAKDAFKAFREQNKDALRGKVAWAGGGEYWIHGDVVQGFAGYSPMAA